MWNICYAPCVAGMSWADHQDALDELEKLVVQDCSSEGIASYLFNDNVIFIIINNNLKNI